MVLDNTSLCLPHELGGIRRSTCLRVSKPTFGVFTFEVRHQPGGGIDKGETPKKGATRELMEELGDDQT